MVSFAAEPIIRLGFFPVTNTILGTILVDLILFAVVFFNLRKLSFVPGFFQNTIEYIIETFYNLTEMVADTRAGKIFPFFMSFFLFILIANWSGLIPGFGTIGFYKNGALVPIFRSTTTDLNATFALAIISAVATHILSLRIIGFKLYLSRYFSLNPLNLFIGFLEMISEITKVISLSFRLFGNVFAGEIVLGTIAAIFAFIFPLPFLFLEIVVGLVQALVFAMLTMSFMAILTTPHIEGEEVSGK